MTTIRDKKVMDDRTLTALQGSIKKWKAIEAGTGYDGYRNNCPLCAEFDIDNRDCEGCPVDNAGFKGCSCSPYDMWDAVCKSLNRIIGETRIADTPELVKLARAEREFLESLLPEGVEK